MAVSTTQPATTTSARVAAALAAPLTVRIIDGRLLLCTPTEERLATAAADAGVDLAALGTVAVLLDDGSTGEWYGAPVVGALKFLDWLTRTRPSVDVTVTAVAALIVDAVELTTKGGPFPTFASDTTRSARGRGARRRASTAPARSARSGSRLPRPWPTVIRTSILHGWFATTVAELALARLGPPQITTTANEARVHRWADQVTARSSRREPAALPPQRARRSRRPLPCVLPLPVAHRPDRRAPATRFRSTADLLGTSPHDAVTMLALRVGHRPPARGSELPGEPGRRGRHLAPRRDRSLGRGHRALDEAAASRCTSRSH